MDSQRLDAFIAMAHQSVGPETLMQNLHVGEWFTRKAASLGIETAGLIKTEEEKAQEQQAQMQQMMQQQASKEAIGVARDVAKNTLAPPNNQPQELPQV